MAIQSLQHLGAVFLSPILTYFNEHLSKHRDDSRPLFFLAREGHWLEQSYTRFAQGKNRTSNTRYMLVSRAFLFKIGLLHPETFPYSLNFKFSGSMYELLRTRFMLSDMKIKQVFSDKEQSRKILLPADLNKVSTLLCSKQIALEPIISKSSDAYKQYLDELGFFETETVDVVDVGYGGTIQTLLSLIFNVNTVGHYLIASKPGTTQIGEKTAVMNGYLKEGVKLGGGYIPLDRSMFLEGLLTAPVGQFQDIRLSPLPARKFDYYYGRKVSTQHHFHLIEAICKGAMAQMDEYIKSDIQFTTSEIEELYTAFVTKKGMLPQDSWPLFEIDDDTANEGTVNGIDFFGLRL
jgi:hypothetical protein